MSLFCLFWQIIVFYGCHNNIKKMRVSGWFISLQHFTLQSFKENTKILQKNIIEFPLISMVRVSLIILMEWLDYLKTINRSGGQAWWDYQPYYQDIRTKYSWAMLVLSQKVSKLQISSGKVKTKQRDHFICILIQFRVVYEDQLGIFNV